MQGMKHRLPITVWILLLAAAVPLLHTAGRIKPAGPLPERWRLPDSIGGWQGERLYYSTDPEVTRAFREEDILQPGVCPVSGAPLDTVSVAERRLLPSDVEIDRRLYRGPGGVFRHAILLITGESREGIHRPEWCLTAQGVRIGDRFHLTAEDEDGKPFGVAVYPVLPRNAPAGYRTDRFFVYWFEGPDAKTAYNLVRILRMGWDRIRRGQVQRWAYYSIQMNIPPGSEDASAAILEAVEWLVRNR